METLQNYIIDMESRMQQEQSSEDLLTQLRLKENDLQLAAELGKALLEDNEKLKRQQEALVEEYSKKLEEVEQDRHLLKRKLTTRESEFEARIVELQNDVLELTEKLANREQTIKQFERDKSTLVADLANQNARLTAQLKDYASVENHLQQQLQLLKEQVAMDKSHLQEHVSSVDGLKDELELATEKRIELERRMHLAASERDNMANALEEASERILLLERHVRDQEMRYQQSIKDYSLPQEKLSIDERISTGEHRSLLAEMDMSEPTLSQECMSVYRQLRSLCQQLKSHSDGDSGLHSDCSTSTDDDKLFTAGLLSEVAQELVGLVLDSDVVRIIERLERAGRDIKDRDNELEVRAANIRELTTKVSMCEVELQAALEERDRARNDASHTSLNQDEVVSKARTDRDQAVTRKNKLEVELAKTRVELNLANGQLIETIQQKVELSEQLEQWQLDMQELLDEQLRNKLSSHEINRKVDESMTTTPVAPPRRSLFKFFYR